MTRAPSFTTSSSPSGTSPSPPRSDPARQNPGFHCGGIQSMPRKGQQLLPADDLRDIPGIDSLLTTPFPISNGPFSFQFHSHSPKHFLTRIPATLGKGALITQLGR